MTRDWIAQVQLRAEAAELLRQQGVFQRDVATRLGISPSQLSVCVQLAAGLQHHPELQLCSAKRAAYEQLRRLHRFKTRRCGC